MDANNKTNPDLFLALKGGSNNLGIVTRFDFTAFKQGKIWGGTAAYPYSTASLQIKAFVNFGNNIERDPYSSIISIWQHSSKTDKTLVVNAYEYTKPIANAPAFDEYLKIPDKIVDTLRITNLTDLTGELEQAYGFRYVLHNISFSDTDVNFRDSFSTLTFGNDERVVQKAMDIMNNKIALAKKSALGDYTIVYLYQPIPTIFSKHSVERGGNILGLDRNKDNLICEPHQ